MKFLNKAISILIIFFMLNSTTTLASQNTPLPKNGEQRIAYITFDDGPTKINTPKLLDELKRLNIPATFFVVGKLINENPEVLERIINENHSIGLHTMSHNKAKCYSSQESFIKENIELRDLIKEKYNITSNLIRFPFGSQNSYLRMDRTFLEKLHSNNFKIFDWHIDTMDALIPTNGPQDILRLVKTQYERLYKDNSNITILMHTNSNNDNTIKSLEIIKNYFMDELGYEFKTLDENSVEVYNMK